MDVFYWLVLNSLPGVLPQVARGIAGGAAAAWAAPDCLPAAGARVAADGAVAAAMAVVSPRRELVDVMFPLRFDRKAACADGWSIVVHVERQLVIVGGASDRKLHCYHLRDGVECSAVGLGSGAGDMQFNWGYNGGVCVTPSGTLLVADYHNNRVPEVDLDVRDHFARVFGQGDGAARLSGPIFVDCNGVHVAVIESFAERVCVLSYADGTLVGRVGSACSEPLSFPQGIKLLADGSGLVVADCNSHRVVLLPLVGNELGTEPLGVQSHSDLKRPTGVVQCAALIDGDAVVMVACCGAAGLPTRLVKVSFRSGVLESVDMAGSAEGRLACVHDFATLPGGDIVTLDHRYNASRFQVFTSLALRMCWVTLALPKSACVWPGADSKASALG